MKLAVLQDKLDDATFTELTTYVDELIGQRDAAKKESIDGRKNLKAELEQLRGLKTKLFDKLGIDDEADIDTLPDAKGQAEAKLQYETKIKRLERELNDKSQAYAGLEAKHKDNLKQVAINQALRGQEWVDAEIAETLLNTRVEWDGDEVFYKTDKGMVPLADGVRLLTEQKPHLLKAAGTAGSGHRASGATPLSESELLAKASTTLLQQISGVNP